MLTGVWHIQGRQSLSSMRTASIILPTRNCFDFSTAQSLLDGNYQFSKTHIYLYNEIISLAVPYFLGQPSSPILLQSVILLRYCQHERSPSRQEFFSHPDVLS